MITKQYSQPQLLPVGDAVQATLYILPFGRRRDNRWFRLYYRIVA